MFTYPDGTNLVVHPSLHRERRCSSSDWFLGQSNSGINVYEFDYKNKAHGEGRFRGVMAQEVPWACSVNNNNQYTVDYSKVDVDFERI